MVLGEPWGGSRLPRRGPWGGLGGFRGRLGRAAVEKLARAKLPQPFGHKKGAKREPQGSHFGSKIRCKIAVDFEGAPGDVFGSPREGPEVKNYGFTFVKQRFLKVGLSATKALRG